ncbi:MAG TPA: FHA domain-containing protein [Pseudonocardia sp.]|nr:FHA domain-containing protein [Pseudonocardia sp.]
MQPALELLFGSRRVRVPADRRFVVGRGPQADLDVVHDRASRTHAVVELTPQGWTVTDHSTNGTFVDGMRVTHLHVTRPMSVRLGDTPDSATVEFRPVGGPGDPDEVSPPPAHKVLTRQGGGTTVHHLPSNRLTVGRLPDNDVVLDDLLVSRRHAELRRDPAGGWHIVDLGSGNGTFVNGARVQQAPVTPRDVVGIGHSLLQLQGDRLVAAQDTGDIAFEARHLTVTVGSGKRLLHDVGFALPGRSLLAVVGPSGAGKSTLLGALTGARPADTGDVRYAGRDLYAEFDELRHRIGLVPQQDVLHPQLTVRRALRYAARLRFPADVGDADRERRIEEVLRELELTHQADQRIDTLSGGQRKRTSVALELLTKPSLLFLDEPTSGLDPGLDKSVMQTLRRLADGSEGGRPPGARRSGEGRTVVVVTHSVAHLDVCDLLLVLAPGGHVAYFGPPSQALSYFGTPDFAEMFLLLSRVPGEQLAHRFRGSPQHRRYIAQPTSAMPRVVQRAAPTVAPRQQAFGIQLAVLCRRYLAVIAADRQYVAFMALLPLLLALLARLVPGDAGLSVTAAAAGPTGRGQPTQLLLVLVVGGALVGIAASIRELVKERSVYVRERGIGLSLGAYLLSKLIVLSALTGLQAAAFTLLALAGRNGPDDAVLLGAGLVEVLVAVVAVTVVTMVAGLLISALVDNADRGMPLLVLVLMVQLIVSGGLFPIHDQVVIAQLSWLVPSRWAFAMGASTIDLNRLSTSPDGLWAHTAGQWLLAAFVLALLSAALVAATALLLRRLDPVRRAVR